MTDCWLCLVFAIKKHILFVCMQKYLYICARICKVDFAKMSQTIEHTGRIQRIDGTSVQVLITQHSACSGCHAKSACTVSDSAEKLVDAETDDTSLQVGDEVLVCARRSSGMLAVLLAFVVPFLLILLVLVVLRAFVDNEALTGTIALASLVPYYVTLSLFRSRLKSTFRFYVKKLS